jgi:transcriptional regulator with XRE-family HTH domain
VYLFLADERQKMPLTMTRSRSVTSEARTSFPQVALDRLARRINRFRTGKGWTQRELARRAGLRSDRLSRLEHGRATPSVQELVNLAEIFGIGLDELVLGRAASAPERSRAEALLSSLAEVMPDGGAGLSELLETLQVGIAELKKARGSPPE